MKRKPVVGDVIRLFEGDKTDYYVIEAKLREDKAYDGSYYAYPIKLLPRGKLGKPKKEKKIHLAGYSINVSGSTEVKLEDLVLLEQVKIKHEVFDVYTVSAKVGSNTSVFSHQTKRNT